MRNTVGPSSFTIRSTSPGGFLVFVNQGPAEADAKELLRLETRWATMSIGDDATVLSIEEKGTGRELIAEPQPVLAVHRASGRHL